MKPRVLLSCDHGGGWTVSGHTSRFPDFEAALHCARRTPALETATIEVWEQGQYVCSLPPDAWPRCRVPGEPAPAASGGGALVTLDRCANRAALVLMSTAGPLFWAAIVLAAVAASLGWRLLLF
jgi:hypothetical protein